MTKKSREKLNKTVTIVLGIAFIFSMLLPVIAALSEILS